MGHHADSAHCGGSNAFAGLAAFCLSIFYGDFCGVLHHGHTLQAA